MVHKFNNGCLTVTQKVVRTKRVNKPWEVTTTPLCQLIYPFISFFCFLLFLSWSVGRVIKVGIINVTHRRGPLRYLHCERVIEGWDRIEGAIVVWIRFIAFIIYTLVLFGKKYNRSPQWPLIIKWVNDTSSIIKKK